MKANASNRPGRLSDAIWRQRLQAARKAAVRRLAANGLNMGIPSSPDDLLVDEVLGPIGLSLNPYLGTVQAESKAMFAKVKGYGDVDGAAMNWVVQAIETAFLYGVITGTCTTWEIVEAIEPPIADESPR